MAASTTTSSTYTSLTFTSTSAPLSLTTSHLPTTTPQGTVLIRVLATHVLPYIKAVQTGKRPYVLTPPLVPSATCIGRIHMAGADAVDPRIRKPGQLVLADMTIRGRDAPHDEGHIVLQGLHAGGDTGLMEEWKAGSYAQFATFPLETVFPLDEDVLLGDPASGKGLGYSIDDLLFLPIALVPMGGLRKLDVRPGESVVVCPASGRFGGAAVHVAAALGARVVAVGRTQEKLDGVIAPLKGPGRVSTLVLRGEAAADEQRIRDAVGGEGADCYVDFSELILSHALLAVEAMLT
jgi:NADPH:quinone reductase-like Zn-dependent oxidoreductase